jgi:hypothetical protein
LWQLEHHISGSTAEGMSADSNVEQQYRFNPACLNWMLEFLCGKLCHVKLMIIRNYLDTKRFTEVEIKL